MPKNALSDFTSEPNINSFIFSFIFQDPLTSLNPLMKIGSQITEAVREKCSKKEKNHIALSLMNQLEISDPEKRIKQYPHELSGGMRQRILIAIALAKNPDIIIADEPATALDRRTKLHMIELLKSFCSRSNKTVIYITHDLASVREFADKILIMYAGKIIESGPSLSVLDMPKHPYSKKLLDLVDRKINDDGKLPFIKGQTPLPTQYPVGCRFHPRCHLSEESCKKKTPEIIGSDAHWWMCPIV